MRRKGLKAVPSMLPVPPVQVLAPDPIAQEIRTRIMPLVRMLAQQEGAVGKLALRWSVSPEGLAQNLTVVENTAGAGIAHKIATLIARWRFPVPAGQDATTYPFLFGDSGSGEGLSGAVLGAPEKSGWGAWLVVPVTVGALYGLYKLADVLVSAKEARGFRRRADLGSFGAPQD